MTFIEINKKMYGVPTKWNELSSNQVLQLMDCLFVKTMSGEMQILKMLQILCNMTYFNFYRADVDEMSQYFYLLEDLLKSKNELTKNLFPQYEGMCGPADEFNNLVMDEFVFSEEYFMQWRGDITNDSALNNLVSILYRQPKKKYDFELNPDGDPRQAFNENISSYNSKLVISKWSMNFKLFVATWYEGCRIKLVEDNPEVFGGQGDPAKYGLISVIRTVAKNGVLGDFSSVEKKYVKLVMIELNESIEEVKALENQMKTK